MPRVDWSSLPTLILLRHGLRPASIKHVGLLGLRLEEHDVPLFPEAAAELEQTADHIREEGIRISRCVVSPFLRTRQTAATVLRALDVDVPVELDVRLREFVSVHPLVLDPVTADALREVYAARGCETAHLNRFRPVDESYEELSGRARSFLDALRGTGGSVLVVTHLAVIQALRCVLEDIPLTSMFDFRVRMGKYVCVEQGRIETS